MLLHHKHSILKVFFKHTLPGHEKYNNFAISADRKNSGIWCRAVSLWSYENLIWSFVANYKTQNNIQRSQ